MLTAQAYKDIGLNVAQFLVALSPWLAAVILGQFSRRAIASLMFADAQHIQDVQVKLASISFQRKTPDEFTQEMFAIIDQPAPQLRRLKWWANLWSALSQSLFAVGVLWFVAVVRKRVLDRRLELLLRVEHPVRHRLAAIG